MTGNEMLKLTREEALKAMVFFLQQYYEDTKSIDTKNIIEYLLKNKDDKILNTALAEWEKCLKYEKIKSMQFLENSAVNFTEENAFEAMVKFLEEYYEATDSDDIGSLLGDLLHGDYGSTSDPAAWYIWQKCLQKVKAEKTIP